MTGSSAVARGLDAYAGVTLGYMGRLGGYALRGEHPRHVPTGLDEDQRRRPALSTTESESERDWRRNLDVSSASSVQGLETTLPPGLPPVHERLDEAPQWMGIASQLPLRRPRSDAPGQYDHLLDPDSDSDGSYELCGG